MTHYSGHFSPDYKTAQQRFRAAAHAAGAVLQSYLMPPGKHDRGPQGEPLATDVAIVGNHRNPNRVFVHISGTHGVEGYFGSAVQLTALSDPAWAKNLPPDAAVILVHAINPHGMAYDRRVNEDRVDQNRNGIDYRALPANAAYDALHPLVMPGKWEAVPAAIAELLRRYRANPQAVFAALQGGQWQHPDGIFYGGNKRCHSHEILARIMAPYRDAAIKVCEDLHTGLGDLGTFVQLSAKHPGEPAYMRAKAIWAGHNVQSSQGGERSVSNPLKGRLTDMIYAMPGEATIVAHEAGTRARERVLAALIKENLFYHLGPPPAGLLDHAGAGPEVREFLGELSAAAIKADMRDAFYPQGVDRTAWEAKVLADGLATFGQAIDYLKHAAPAPARQPAQQYNNAGPSGTS